MHEEIAIMKKLEHRNLVRLYEVIDDEDNNALSVHRRPRRRRFRSRFPDSPLPSPHAGTWSSSTCRSAR